jgi:hypothetical protein
LELVNKWVGVKGLELAVQLVTGLVEQWAEVKVLVLAVKLATELVVLLDG